MLRCGGLLGMQSAASSSPEPPRYVTCLGRGSVVVATSTTPPYGQGLARSEEQVSVAKIGLSGPIEDMQIKGAEINMVVEGYKT